MIKKIRRTEEDRAHDEELHELQWKAVKYKDDLNYADIVQLWMLVDIARKAPKSGRYNDIPMESHSKDILPVRNPVMHTNELSDEAYNWNKVRNMINYIDKLAN